MCIEIWLIIGRNRVVVLMFCMKLDIMLIVLEMIGIIWNFVLFLYLRIVVVIWFMRLVLLRFVLMIIIVMIEIIVLEVNLLNSLVGLVRDLRLLI